MAGYWVKPLDAVPRIAPEEEGGPDWYPLQHHFGLTAFGINVYEASRAGVELVGEHDEAGSGQEEIYVVVSGAARFELEGEVLEAPALTVVAITEPAVRRSAVATEAGTRLIAVGGRAQRSFESSWQAHHFEGVPRAAGYDPGP